MTLKEECSVFTNCRPDVLAAFAYGEGALTEIENKKKHSSINLLYVVSDVKKFHQTNLVLNPSDYSFMGKLFYSKELVKNIKGPNGVSTIIGVKENNLKFNYSVVEIRDFERQLLTWDKMILAKTMMQPVVTIKNQNRLEHSINENRKHALITALQFVDDYDSIVTLYEKIVAFSYLKEDTMFSRTKTDEIKKSLQRDFELLDALYNNGKYFTVTNGKIFLNHDKLAEEALPAYLAYALSGKKKGTVEYLYAIEEYIRRKNTEEELKQGMHNTKSKTYKKIK